MINIRMQPQEVRKLSPKLAVIGVGGAGGNAVNNMISTNLEGVEFLVCNTDAQSLDNSLCPHKIQLGEEVTGGLGAGARPEVGRAAAEETIEEVLNFIEGANMVFITAGMGGGTGTGGAPIIAKACRERGVLTVGVVTKPFHFEGSYRMKMADQGIEEMQNYVDTLIVIPNQNLFRVANEKTTFSEAFKMADSVLQSGVRGVTDLMVMPGLINLDFADVRSAMLDQGKAMLGTGEAEGERRAVEAAESAINNPLLDDVSMKGAKGVIINITGGYDMTLFEADEACNRIREEVDAEANIIFGSTFDENMEGTMRVSVIATGIDHHKAQKKTPAAFDRTLSERPKTMQKMEGDSVNDGAGPTTAAAAPPSIPKPAKPDIPTAPPQQNTNTSSESGKEEPENELFEQQAYTPSQSVHATAGSSQNTAMRGTRYNDSFIPPKPVEIDKAEKDNMASFASTTATQKKSEISEQYAPSPAVSEEESPKPGYNLRPPVQPSRQEQEQHRRTSPSLFERITGIGGNFAHGRDNQEVRSCQVPSSPSVKPAQPTQGSLAIDSPAAKPTEKPESDLDIPAFLRRQAN